MRLFLYLFVLVNMFFLSILQVKALSFEEAFSQVSRTPMVVLIYADWANGYESSIAQFRIAKNALSNNFNFVELDITKKEARAFNEKFHIYPKLPYILMFRDGGKVSRYIPRDCAQSSACVISKLKSFIQ